MKYYWLYSEEKDTQGVAYAPEEVSFLLLYQCGRIREWVPPVFELRDGVATDYLANDVGWCMCSSKLRSCFTPYLAHDGDFQWLPATVTVGAHVRIECSILHAAVERDFLDKERSTFTGDHLIKPVLNANLIGRTNIIAVNGRGSIYVSDRIRKDCLRANVTGVKFVKAPCVSS